jgi:hypothetical protein
MITLLDQALGALLDFRLAEWHGLTPCLTADIVRIFGAPSSADDAYLGSYPAIREMYSAPKSAATGLIVYSRADRVVAVETVEPPPVEAMDSLGQPDARKPPEFTLPDYLVREYLYCRHGLVLSVAESLTSVTGPRLKIVRCRGIPILAAPHEYGAEYYLALQNSLVFRDG